MTLKVPKPRKKPTEAPPPLSEAPSNLDIAPRIRLKTFSFKVTPEFHREFKLYAVTHGKDMLDIMKEGYRLYKERYGS